jgi:hypothetical protein
MSSTGSGSENIAASVSWMKMDLVQRVGDEDLTRDAFELGVPIRQCLECCTRLRAILLQLREFDEEVHLAQVEEERRDKEATADAHQGPEGCGRGEGWGATVGRANTGSTTQRSASVKVRCVLRFHSPHRL